MSERNVNELMVPSSMDSFLDDYQIVRLTVSVMGLVVLVAFGLALGWSVVGPYVAALSLSGGHALWCRFRKIRSPLSMLLLDTTVWGAMMVVAGDPVISAVSLAFLFVLAVLFSDGYWRLSLLAGAAAWYALSVLIAQDLVTDSYRQMAGVFLISGGLATMIHRVRAWLGRLDAGRSQMLGTVSHELRNNLTGMMGLTEIVSTDPDLSREEARDLVIMAHQQAVDASEIVEDLLTATRLERSALSVALEAVDVSAEVETTVRRFVGEGIVLSLQTTSGLPPAAADALRVRQILRNLVSNAVRYGGSSIRVTTDAVGAGIRVTVGDDGDGVPREDEATIFLPYRRSTRSRHAASVGLGLWISRQLADAMGGGLEYQRVDGWTEFVLTLNVHDGGPGQLSTRPRVRNNRSVGHDVGGDSEAVAAAASS